MPKYFVLATKVVELRGTIIAHNVNDAKDKVLGNWFVHDTKSNTVTAGTAEKRGKSPIISEYPQNLRILHIQDEEGYIHKHGIEMTKLEKEGKWKEIG